VCLFIHDVVLQTDEDSLAQWLQAQADEEDINNAHLVIPQISLFFTLMAICVEGF
jgi:hypothetical protein